MRVSSLSHGFAAVLLVLAAQPASAEIFRCKLPDGRMAYQDVACPEEGEQKVVAPSRVAPPPPRRMSDQDYYDQRVAYQNQQERARQQMQVQQLNRRERSAKPYVAGIGENRAGCRDDIERRKEEVRNGTWQRTGDQSYAIAKRRAELERCN